MCVTLHIQMVADADRCSGLSNTREQSRCRPALVKTDSATVPAVEQVGDQQRNVQRPQRSSAQQLLESPFVVSQSGLE